MDKGLVGIGTLLIVAAVTPTPDDVTIVSPALQLTAGTILVGVGLLKKGGK